MFLLLCTVNSFSHLQQIRGLSDLSLDISLRRNAWNDIDSAATMEINIMHLLLSALYPLRVFGC